MHGLQAAEQFKQMAKEAAEEKEKKKMIAERAAALRKEFGEGAEHMPENVLGIKAKSKYPEQQKPLNKLQEKQLELANERLEGAREERGVFQETFGKGKMPSQTQQNMNESEEVQGQVNEPEEDLEAKAAFAGQPGRRGVLGQQAKLKKERLDKEKKEIKDLKMEHSKDVRQSFSDNKPYIDKTYDQYEDSLRKEAILDRMVELDESGETSENGVYNALEALGLRPEWLNNSANEEYNKLALDLLGGGTLQADYGSKVLQSEFHVSMQRIPQLNQTKEGRRQIAENLKAMTAPSRLKRERMQYYIDKAEREDKPLPHDLRGKVLRDIQPQLETIYDNFKQRNGRYKVKTGTEVDDNSIEKYYYISGKNLDKAKKMMKEDGYDID